MQLSGNIQYARSAAVKSLGEGDLTEDGTRIPLDDRFPAVEWSGPWLSAQREFALGHLHSKMRGPLRLFGHRADLTGP